jgi:hypothetical protein
VKRRVIKATYLLLACGVCARAFVVGRTVWTFGVEDKIHAAFYPVIRALDHYSKEHGNPPEGLNVLCPEYLEEVPSSMLVSEVRYQRLPNKHGWRLILESRATGNHRLYIAEDGMPLSDKESRDVVLHYHHRWFVREPQ